MTTTYKDKTDNDVEVLVNYAGDESLEGDNEG